METAAQRVAREIAESQKDNMKALTERVSLNIKNCGYSDFICDDHVKTSINGGTISLKDDKVYADHLRKEGFKVHYEFNGYRVRSMVVTL